MTDNNDNFEMPDIDEFIEMNIDNSEIDIDIEEQMKKHDPKTYAKMKLRDKITMKAGDTQSLLGTTSDAATLSLIANATLIKTLSQHGSAAIKKTISGAHDGKLLALSNSLLSDIEQGEIEFPALMKGLENVVLELKERSNNVAKVLKENS